MQNLLPVYILYSLTDLPNDFLGLYFWEPSPLPFFQHSHEMAIVAYF